MPGGGLMQLVATGADNHMGLNTPYLTTDCVSYNHRDQMEYWFVDRENGVATMDDVEFICGVKGILDHVPITMRPHLDNLAPFKVR